MRCVDMFLCADILLKFLARMGGILGQKFDFFTAIVRSAFADWSALLKQECHDCRHIVARRGTLRLVAW